MIPQEGELDGFEVKKGANMMIRGSVKSINGKLQFDLRKWVNTENDGWRPMRKGIQMSFKNWLSLIPMVRETILRNEPGLEKAA